MTTAAMATPLIDKTMMGMDFKCVVVHYQSALFAQPVVVIGYMNTPHLAPISTLTIKTNWYLG